MSDELPQPEADAGLEQISLLDMMVQQVLGACGPTSRTGATPENVEPMLRSMLEQLGPVVEALIGNMHGDAAEKRPFWGFVARDRNTHESQVLLAPKDSGACLTLQQKLFFATVYAFLHEPAILAWLAVHGVHIQFVEQESGPKSDNTPKLII